MMTTQKVPPVVAGLLTLNINKLAAQEHFLVDATRQHAHRIGGSRLRDVEELLAERGIEVDHVTIYRWVQRFTPMLIDAARPCRHGVGGRWFVDETYVKVAGRWRYVYRVGARYSVVGC